MYSQLDTAQNSEGELDFITFEVLMILFKYIFSRPPDTVRLGDLDLENDDDNQHAQQYSVVEVIQHPEYSSQSRYHDLALLKLNDSVR